MFERWISKLNKINNLRWFLEDVAAQIEILDHVREAAFDVLGVDGDLLARHIRRIKRDVLEDSLHDGVQPPCADVFHLLVDLCRERGDFIHRIVRERNFNAFGFKQSRVLDYESVVGLCQYPHKFIKPERI